MILSKEEQDGFFSNYLKLLCYAAVYEGLLPGGSKITDFGRLPLIEKIKSRDALFTDAEIMHYFLADNKAYLTKENIIFAENVRRGILSDFIVMSQHKKSCVLMQTSTGLFYEVLNITDPFEKMLSHIPSLITAAIINFNGKIVCDGLIKGGNIQIGPNSEKKILDQYHTAKTNRAVMRLL